MNMKEVIDMINIRTVIISSTIRIFVKKEEAEILLKRIDQLCNIEHIRNQIHNKLELMRVGKERRI